MGESFLYADSCNITQGVKKQLKKKSQSKQLVELIVARYL